jgi:hypothetical protein
MAIRPGWRLGSGISSRIIRPDCANFNIMSMFRRGSKWRSADFCDRMSRMTGLLSLPDARAIPPALYLILCSALEKGAVEAGVTQKDLDASFRLWLKDRAEEKDDLKITARDILMPAIPKKKAVISPIQKHALVSADILQPAEIQSEEFEPENFSEEMSFETEENDFAEFELEGFEFEEYEDAGALREGLLEYAAQEHAGKAVAALMLAEEIAPSSDLGAKSCDILLNKYGTQSVTAEEKHMLLDGIAAASTSHDRADFRDKFSILAAQETDADSTLKQKLAVLSEENDPRKLLMNSFKHNTGDAVVMGAGQTSPALVRQLAEKAGSFIDTVPREPMRYDLPKAKVPHPSIKPFLS